MSGIAPGPAGVPGRVLVTDGEFKHALGISRALHDRGHEIHLVARSGRAPAAHSRAVHRVHYLPAPKDPAYPEALLACASSLAPVSLVLVGDGAVAAADLLRARWPADVHMALPPAESLAVANDKARTGALARTLGVATPGERAVDTLPEATESFAQFGGRAVFKSRFEAGRKILRYVRRADEVAAAYEYVRALSGAGPLVQEHVDGDGWAYFALYWHGRRVRRFLHRRVREWPPSGGTSACAESVLEAPGLEQAGEALLDALAWHGVAMVECKRTPEGRFVLMEINAKFWGSHDLALAAGVDFPGDLVALLEGREPAQPQPPYRRVRLSWPLGGDLWHGIARPSAMPRVLLDAVSPGVAHTFRLSDPLPSLYEAMQWARSTPNALKEARELS
jgi:predicted ATP-grasp superfamily ATP-dependent carboligase